MFTASTSPSPIRLTISRARSLAAEAPTGATYHRAYEGDVEVDRGHVPAVKRAWDMDAIIDHLEAGRRVELRTGAADGEALYVLDGVDPRARASI